MALEHEKYYRGIDFLNESRVINCLPSTTNGMVVVHEQLEGLGVTTLTHAAADLLSAGGNAVESRLYWVTELGLLYYGDASGNLYAVHDNSALPSASSASDVDFRTVDFLTLGAVAFGGAWTTETSTQLANGQISLTRDATNGMLVDLLGGVSSTRDVKFSIHEINRAVLKKTLTFVFSITATSNNFLIGLLRGDNTVGDNAFSSTNPIVVASVSLGLYERIYYEGGANDNIVDQALDSVTPTWYKIIIEDMGDVGADIHLVPLTSVVGTLSTILDVGNEAAARVTHVSIYDTANDVAQALGWFGFYMRNQSSGDPNTLRILGYRIQ